MRGSCVFFTIAVLVLLALMSFFCLENPHGRNHDQIHTQWALGNLENVGMFALNCGIEHLVFLLLSMAAMYLQNVRMPR